MANENEKPNMGGEEILDFSDVRPFEPLDSSVMYLCRVSNLEKKMASTGKKMATAELEIIKPEEVRVEEWTENDEGDLVFTGLSERTIKAQGRKLFRNFTLEAKALPFLYNFLKACDPDVDLTSKDKDGNVVPYKFVPGEWIGRELAVKGENSAYEEQVRLQPNKLYPATKYQG